MGGVRQRVVKLWAMVASSTAITSPGYSVMMVGWWRQATCVDRWWVVGDG